MMLYLYRGDSRPPEIIFKEGFMPKVVSDKAELSMTSAFEASPDCVSFSSEFAPAGLFPLEELDAQKEATINSWIYVAAVDDSQPPSDYCHFHDKSLSIIPRLQTYLLPAGEYAKEHIVKKVPPSEVLFAIPIKRIGKIVDSIFYSDSFEITATLVLNQNANPELLNSSKATKIQQQLTSQIKQAIKIPVFEFQSSQEQATKQYQSAFFVRERFAVDELQTVKPINRPQKFAVNEQFFQSSQYSNSAGVLFASKEKFYQQNASFYAAVTRGDFEQQIEEKRPILQMLIENSRSSLRKTHGFFSYQDNIFISGNNFILETMRDKIQVNLDKCGEANIEAIKVSSDHLFYLQMGMIPKDKEIPYLKTKYGIFGQSAIASLQKHKNIDDIDSGKIDDLKDILHAELGIPEDKITKQLIADNRQFLLDLQKKTCSYLQYEFIPTLLNALKTNQNSDCLEIPNFDSVTMELSESARMRWHETVSQDKPFKLYKNYEHLTPLMTDKQKERLARLLNRHNVNLDTPNQPKP